MTYAAFDLWLSAEGEDNRAELERVKRILPMILEECCTVKQMEYIFRPGSLIWSVMEGDWSDLTPKQIGEVLGTSGRSVTVQIIKIRRITGYSVPHDQRRGPPNAIKGGKR